MKGKLLLFVSYLVILVTINITSSYSAMEGLVGAWLLDEASGNKAKDSSGKGHDGELVGKAKFDKGKFGNAVSCDGTEAYVMVPNHEDFKFKGDFSIACWFLNDNAPPPDNSGIVTKGYHRPAGSGGDSKPWYLIYFIKGAGTVDLYLRDTKSTNSRAVGKTPVNDGKWHHIVCMKVGNKVKVFIDGKEDAAADAVDAVYGDNDQPLVFMVHYDRWIKGLIDDVAIFNRAITEKEISSIMGGLSKSVLAVLPSGNLVTTWGELRVK